MKISNDQLLITLINTVNINLKNVRISYKFINNQVQLILKNQNKEIIMSQADFNSTLTFLQGFSNGISVYIVDKE